MTGHQTGHQRGGWCGSALLSVASFLTIIGACGAAVGTAGAMTPVCVGALVGHIGSNVVMLASCATCVDCLDTGPPGDGGGGGSGNDPSGECPAGYHECCNNNCCSDDNPPAGCNEV